MSNFFSPILHYNPAYFTSCTMVDFDEKNSVIQNAILINMHVSIKADKLRVFFLRFFSFSNETLCVCTGISRLVMNTQLYSDSKIKNSKCKSQKYIDVLISSSNVCLTVRN